MKMAQGTIKKPVGKTFETKYGEKKMLIVEMSDGGEEKFYCNPTQEPHVNFKKGDRVGVIYEMRDGRNIRRLVSMDDEPQQSSTPAPRQETRQETRQSYSSPKREEISADDYVKKEVSNIVKIYQEVLEGFKGTGIDLTGEDLRSIVISINIGLQQQYNRSAVLESADLDEDEDEDEEEEAQAKAQEAEEWDEIPF